MNNSLSYIYICNIYMYIYMHNKRCINEMYTCIYVYFFVVMCFTCVYVWMVTCAWLCVRVYACSYVCSYVCVVMCLHVYMCGWLYQSLLHVMRENITKKKEKCIQIKYIICSLMMAYLVYIPFLKNNLLVQPF